MHAIVTELIDMDLRHDEKSEDKHHEYGIDPKAEPEHREKNKD